MRGKLRRITTLHFFLALATAGQLIAYDAGRLFPPEVVLRRWIAIGIYTSVLCVIWYAARNRSGQPETTKKLVGLLIITGVAFASFNVYSQRGMASRAVLLYLVPIITAAMLARRSAVIASAIFATSAYVVTSVAYFVLNFNEGYKLELYGEVGYYAATFLIVSGIVWIISSRQSS